MDVRGRHAVWDKLKKWWMPAVFCLALGAMMLSFAVGQASFRPLTAREPEASASAPGPAASGAAASGAPRSGSVNINTAGLEELMTLPGIGESRARAILDYRAEHGPFVHPEDLIRVTGIGENILAGLIDDITT